MHNIFNAWNMNNIRILWPIPHTPTHTLHTITVAFTSPLMEAPSSLNCCTTQLNLKYKVQLITPNKTDPRYSNVFHTFSTETSILCHSRQDCHCWMLLPSFKFGNTVSELRSLICGTSLGDGTKDKVENEWSSSDFRIIHITLWDYN
jgi:hypothetical protein